MGKTPEYWTDAEVRTIRKQLETLLQSELFVHSHRQSRFLQYVVEEELAGRGAQLSQYAIANDVFDRDASFDPLVDSIVRVEARRLRSKLTEYYSAQGQNDRIIIKLLKGHYRISVDQRSHVSLSSPTETALATPVEKPSVAVLPFDNLSGDPAQDYFSDGMTEDIITDLSKISGLFVFSRHSTFVYKGKSLTCRDVSDDLGAHYVLEGSVRKAGEQLRISAQLIDASSDGHLWAERYDRKLDDVFAIQDDVTRRIVNALRLKLTNIERQRLGHKGTTNTTAHDLFLRAQERFYQFTPEGVNSAVELLSQSIEADSSYAAAYAWKSRVLLFEWMSGMNPSRPEAIESALKLSRRALALDDLLPLAHASLGWTLMWDRQIEAAIDAVSTALELDSNFADGFLWHSLALSSAGRGEAALEAIEQGLHRNPYYTVTYLMAIGIAHFTLGQYTEALTYFNRGIHRNPHFIFNHLFSTSTLALMGRAQEAAAAKSRLMAFDHYQLVVKDAFFFNDKRLLKLFTSGLAKAGL